MKKILITCGLLLALVVFAESREYGPFRSLQTLFETAQTITAPWRFPGGSESNPSIGFDDDGNSGWFSDTDDEVKGVAGGTATIIFTSVGFGSTNSSRWLLRQTAPTSIQPNYSYNDDPNSGGGKSGADLPNIIAGGKEMTRWDGSADSGATLWTDGGIVIGDISGATVSPASGQTSFVLIISGASPSGSPVDASTLYTFNDLMYAQNPAGDVIQITPHDPETGEIYTNTYNVYTGKGIKYYPLSGISTEYTVPKADWTAVQVRHQKKVFINSYTQQPIEVPEGQATALPDVEVDDGTKTKKWKFEKGKKVEYWANGKKTEKGKFKTVKPDHWMDEDGKFWRKRTRDEAIVAYTVDTTAIKAKYDKLAPFLKAVIPDPGA